MDTKTFNVLDAITGVAYPTDEVTVYKAPIALYEYAQIESQINYERDPEKVEVLEARQAELREQIKATALKFTLRGFAPRISREILKQAHAQFKVPDGADLQNYPDAWEWLNHKTVAESLLTVEKVATEEVDERRFSVEDVATLLGDLEPSEGFKITGKAFELSLQALMYDAAVTPDFL